MTTSNERGMPEESASEERGFEKPDFLVRFESTLETLENDIEETKMSIADINLRKWMPVFRNKINIAMATIYMLQKKGLLDETQGEKLSQKAIALKENNAPSFDFDKISEQKTDPEEPANEKKGDLVKELRSLGEDIVSAVEKNIEAKKNRF